MSQFDLSKRLDDLTSVTFSEQHRLRKRMSAMEATVGLMQAGRAPRMPVEFRSQYGEDALLWDLFRGQWDGFFIEVGAFDGYEFSVSYAFESIGWKGLLIEAIPERYAQCAARRTGSRVVHAALSCRGASGTTQFTVTEDHYGGMLSYLDPSSEHARAVPASFARQVVTVPVTTMSDLLVDHQGDIDFVVIDVEGVELLVVDGFDLEKHRPKVLLIEDNHKNGDPQLTAAMDRAGYKQVGHIKTSRLFVRSDLETAFRQRLRW